MIRFSVRGVLSGRIQHDDPAIACGDETSKSPVAVRVRAALPAGRYALSRVSYPLFTPFYFSELQGRRRRIFLSEERPTVVQQMRR